MNSHLVRELADQVREEFAGRFIVEAVLEASAASCHLVVREQAAPARRLLLHAFARAALRGRGLDASLATTLARWREFQHSGAVPLESAGESERLRWAIVAHPQGATLADRLRERGAFDRSMALGLVASLSEVLAAAHAHGLTHGDIRAAQVILLPDDRLRLGGFGVAAAVEALAGMPVPAATEAGDQSRLARLYVACRLGMPSVVDGDVEAPNDARFTAAERQVLARAQGIAPEGPYPSVVEFVSALRAPPLTVPRAAPSPAQQPLLFVDAPAHSNRAWRVGLVASLVLLGAMPAQRIWTADVNPPSVVPLRSTPVSAPATPEAPAPEPSRDRSREASPSVPERATAKEPAKVAVAPRAVDRRPTTNAPSRTARTPAPTPTPSAASTPSPLFANPEPVAPPAPPAPPAPAELGVSTRPWGHLYIDGRYVGDTPIAALSLDPGSHLVRVVRPGYRPVERSLVVRPGERVRLTDIELVRVAP